MIKILFLAIPDSIDLEVFNALLFRLPPEKQSRISRFIREQDRLCALWADVLVRTTICSTLGIKNTALAFAKNEFGKPCLESCPGLHFNVSHSGDVVLCAFDNKPVGVDVERIKDRGLEIAERFFSKIEYEWLMHRNETDRTECFFDLWTLKESYIKALGKGISKGLRSFTIHSEGQNIFVDDEENENARKDYFFRRYHVKTGFKAAVCAQNSDFPATVTEIRSGDLFREFIART
jgi:4'-phosphopantetheinyl transferase